MAGNAPDEEVLTSLPVKSYLVLVRIACQFWNSAKYPGSHTEGDACSLSVRNIWIRLINWNKRKQTNQQGWWYSNWKPQGTPFFWGWDWYVDMELIFSKTDYKPSKIARISPMDCQYHTIMALSGVGIIYEWSLTLYFKEACKSSTIIWYPNPICMLSLLLLWNSQSTPILHSLLCIILATLVHKKLHVPHCCFQKHLNSGVVMFRR